MGHARISVLNSFSSIHVYIWNMSRSVNALCLGSVYIFSYLVWSFRAYYMGYTCVNLLYFKEHGYR